MQTDKMNSFAYWMTLAASLVALNAQGADAFNPDDWKHHQKLVIDTTADGVELKQGASLVPLALRLHSGNFAFAEAKPDGSDVRVTAADGKTPLRFHLEKYDATNELAVLWVQQPKLAPSAKSDAVQLWWGNDKAAPAGESAATYDPAQSLVLHFSEGAAPRDATGNGNHPKADTLRSVPGPLGDAIRLDGGAGLVVLAAPSLRLVAANGFTFTAWVKVPAKGGGVLFQQGSGNQGLSLAVRDGRLVARAGGQALTSRGSLPVDSWQQVGMTLLGGKLTLYLEGADTGSGDAALADQSGDVHLGEGFLGELDEVTLAATARSADYLKALYGSQQADSLLFAQEDEGGGEGASYLGILLGALTVDGWVVIGILAVMGGISFSVMVGKTLFLGRTDKANNVFLERFRASPRTLLDPVAGETLALAENEAVRHSSIYRLYAIGIREIRHRFEAQQAAGKGTGLTAAALDAIRAAMDAAMVRENQRLNSQIVLLTIAISGGPFLGLLGTVVGVMITFAAIAAAGDVNVNSIAPGIAAALVATVAGLAVAIPALFGYNWLSIRIKNVAADTQVFSDEFLTKSAELYAG